ncbi:MAG: holo-ACP synthase [Oscillospiraceae bacterium]|nr:holo-ACP synthase [Oscillospiraceae bacterium]
MIYGIGNDMIEIRRIRRSLSQGRFACFVYSEKERAAFGGDAVKLAGCFAAKEALGKALGTGVRGFSLREVSVLRDALGKPYFELDGAAAEILRSRRLRAFVALTNTGVYALANVVLEEEA